MADDAKREGTPGNASDVLNLSELIPEHFARLFAFFRPAHNEGAVPARVKELARLRVATLNECDT